MNNSLQGIGISPEVQKLMLYAATAYTAYQLYSLLGGFGATSQTASMFKIFGQMTA